MQLNGLHHVTAVTAQAARNVEFYTQVLGLRLVKKTVNQDDVSAYHLFYADAHGSPGTDVTFFDWPQTPKNYNGAGSIARVGLRVASDEALDWWAQRLADHGLANRDINEFGERRLFFSDPEGLELELVSDRGEPGGTPWELSTVPVEMAIKGLNSVKLMVSELEPTAQVLSQVMGFEPVREYNLQNGAAGKVIVFGVNGGGPGREVHVEFGPHLRFGRLGHGGVHHVAFRTATDEEQKEWRKRIFQSGLQVTDIIDRFYFKSIYFREPGGILFEIATDGPGFASDEDIEHLGEQLALPPFLEPYRVEIEKQLKPL